MRAPALLVLSCLATLPLSAQQPDARASVTVGTATARRGQSANGFLRIPAGPDSATNVPVTIVNGTRPGPLVAIIAGSHGTEYTSIVALTRLASHIDPRNLSGTVIVAPLLNVASFNQMTVHTNPVDAKGMNASYPGDAAGTQTLRVLAAVTEQIVKPADVIIDLHGGDLDEDLRPYSYWIRTGKASQDSASRALALAFGLDMIIVRDIDVANPASIRSLSGYGLSLGKTALVAEAGRSGTVLADDLAALTEGTLNALGALKMIDRNVRPIERAVWVDAGGRVAADSAVMFFSTVGRGAAVSEGMKVGYTMDYFGRTIGDVKSPLSGVVTFIRGVPSAWKGATLVAVSRVYSEVPPWRKP